MHAQRPYGYAIHGSNINPPSRPISRPSPFLHSICVLQWQINLAVNCEQNQNACTHVAGWPTEPISLVFSFILIHNVHILCFSYLLPQQPSATTEKESKSTDTSSISGGFSFVLLDKDLLGIAHLCN